MANTKSAIKRIRRIAKQTAVNKARKSKYKIALKKMNALIENKKKTEALKYFLKATQIKKDYFQAYNNLTIIYLELNHIDEALKTCNKSIEINPTNIEAYNFAGLIF